MATAELAFTMINLPTDSNGIQRAVQRTYVGSTNIYAIQKFGNNSIISRAPYSAGDSIVDFSLGDKMTLVNTGHSQTLDWYSYNNRDYFLVAIDPKANEPTTDDQWATQIGRIEYQSNTEISVYTQVERWSKLNYANASQTSFGTTLRVEGAVSTSHKFLVFATVRISDHHAQFTLYDLVKANKALDDRISQGYNYLPCDLKSMKNAVSTYVSNPYWLTTKSIYTLAGNHSLQGLDISDGAALYLTSGKVGTKPTVTKAAWKGGFVSKLMDNFKTNVGERKISCVNTNSFM